MPRFAVVKPDHLGDLVLSTPAMRFVHDQASGDVSFFTASAARVLLDFLFPDIKEKYAVDFPHLSKTSATSGIDQSLVRRLNDHQAVFFLRDDPEMRALASLLSVPSFFNQGGHLTHETSNQKRCITQVLPNYPRTAYFSGGPIFWPAKLERIGLCVAAGYPTNRWPNAYWMRLARLIAKRGIDLTLIGGPAESVDLRVISANLVDVRHKILEGRSELMRFFDGLQNIDLVIASDGGTAHLCSIKKPVLSIFGSSPWRQFAPFGWNNVVMTRDLVCSPCVQFSTEEINGCVTRECTAGISPEAVLSVATSNGLDFSLARGVQAWRGVSHRYEAQ